MLEQLAINDFSRTPKYVQLYNSVVEGIRNKDILPGAKLPSIFEVCVEFDVSKGTVERAYELLKEKKIVDSTKGKGFYISDLEIDRQLRVFLLFNKLSAHKKLIYDAFIEQVGIDVPIDFFIYNNDFRLFKNHVLSNGNNYSHYVIITHFFEGGERATDLINTLPKHKLIVLDKLPQGLTGRYSAVYQDFENDLFQALTEALPLLRKYTALNLLFPDYTYHPVAILNGFHRFCSAYGFASQVIPDATTVDIAPGHAFINLVEDDLVMLIKRIKDTSYVVGQQVGILSYNETPLKEVLLDGITVISTDFVQMGYSAAHLVQANTIEHIKNPFQLIVRHSL